LSVSNDRVLRQTGPYHTDEQQTLLDLTKRGKTVVVLDACHPGNVKGSPADKPRRG
jgi:hypothetical protein